MTMKLGQGAAPGISLLWGSSFPLPLVLEQADHSRFERASLCLDYDGCRLSPGIRKRQGGVNRESCRPPAQFIVQPLQRPTGRHAAAQCIRNILQEHCFQNIARSAWHETDYPTERCAVKQ